MATKLSKVAAERGIEYFLISFVDLFGSLRSKLVPARAIDGMQKRCWLWLGFACLG
jgi:L-glutamine synthetase (EC 6.3.1.2)